MTFRSPALRFARTDGHTRPIAGQHCYGSLEFFYTNVFLEVH